MIDAIYTESKSLYTLTKTSISTWFGHSVQAFVNTLNSVTKTSVLSGSLLSNVKESTQNKKIVFCADGTWQTPKNDTNVYKIFKGIKALPDQVVFYDDGVGADGLPLEKLTGGALGVGLFDKVKTAYSRIAEMYKPGDEIFLFGFSRGAYTARSIAGMISICGLPTTTSDATLVDKAFQAYRFPALRDSILKDLSSYKLQTAPIKMVGVWDTVGSLGIPAIFGEVGPLYGFLDTNLHPNIANAYHALAIDEWRHEFPATLWTPSPEPVPRQTLEQVWFPGSHGNVGGGYSKETSSDVPLCWMTKKAEDLGLQMDPAVMGKYPLDMKSALAKINDSWSLLWLWPSLRKITPDSSLSNTVEIRSEHNKSYRPKNLIWENGALASSYKIQEVLSPVHSS